MSMTLGRFTSLNSRDGHPAAARTPKQTLPGLDQSTGSGDLTTQPCGSVCRGKMLLAKRFPFIVLRGSASGCDTRFKSPRILGSIQ